MGMEYSLDIGAWNSVFAVPCALVDQHIKLAGKEQLQVLLWFLRHGGKSFSPDDLAGALGISADSALDALEYWGRPGPAGGKGGRALSCSAKHRRTGSKAGVRRRCGAGKRLSLLPQKKPLPLCLRKNASRSRTQPTLRQERRNPPISAPFFRKRRPPWGSFPPP